jgi:hypothetical protein
MAVLIDIEKRSESGATVEYQYSVGSRHGVFVLDTSTGEIELLDSMLGDDQGRLFARAAYKIRKCWEAGEVPNKATWAS